MRSIIIFLALAGVAILAWLILGKPEEKQESAGLKAISVSQHSETFNYAIGNLLNVYQLIQEDFVNWDSVVVRERAIDMGVQLNNLKLDELKTDSSIYLTAQTFIDNAKYDAQTITDEKGIRQQREAFNNLTDNLYKFLNTVKYDGQKLYLQECPMAFDDVNAAHWISKNEEIRNPYLGLKDPKYGKGMLKCGETKLIINHTGKE